ncbi:MAG: hypothetical protein J0M20_18030 [Burkholderiales bacterium]|nr:hypothetical protein [Burkholderiales bacterium]
MPAAPVTNHQADAWSAVAARCDTVELRQLHQHTEWAGPHLAARYMATHVLPQPPAPPAPLWDPLPWE